MPSGGASVPYYMTPSLQQLLDVAANRSGWENTLWPIGNHWDMSEETEGGNLRIVTSLDIIGTGEVPPDVQNIAFCKVACFYLLSQMTYKSLLEASENLCEIYTWQLKENNVELDQSNLVYLGSYPLTKIEEPPSTNRKW